MCTGAVLYFIDTGGSPFLFFFFFLIFKSSQSSKYNTGITTSTNSYETARTRFCVVREKHEINATGICFGSEPIHFAGKAGDIFFTRHAVPEQIFKYVTGRVCN